MEHRTEADVAAPEIISAFEAPAPSAQPLQRASTKAATRVALALTPPQMLAAAIDRGADLAMIEKLMDLADRWEKTNARRAYIEAMAKVKAAPITVVKSKHVKIQDGPQYKHATLADVVDAVVARLGQFGFSHRWVTVQDGPKISVTCIVTHEQGHSEEETQHGAPDGTGKKNALQQMGSTVTYLQRYTLTAIMGLAAKDQHDDDGRDSGKMREGTEEIPCITPEQVRELSTMLRDGGHDLTKFLRHIRCDALGDIYARNFETVKAEIFARKGSAKTAAGVKMRVIDLAQLNHLRAQIDKAGVREVDLLRRYQVDQLESLPFEQLQPALAWLAGVNR